MVEPNKYIFLILVPPAMNSSVNCLTFSLKKILFLAIMDFGKFSILKNPTKPSILKMIIMVITLLNNIHTSFKFWYYSLTC